MSQVKTEYKIASTTNGDFTTDKNHCSIRIPDHYKVIDGTTAHLQMDVRACQRSAPSTLCPTLHEYNFTYNNSDAYRLIKTLTLRSTKKGVLEQVPDVNVILTNIKQFENDTNEKRSMEVISGNLANKDYYSSFVRKNRTGDVASIQQNAQKVFLKDLLGLFNYKYLPTGSLGDVFIDIEFEREKARLDKLFKHVSGFPYNETAGENATYGAGNVNNKQVNFADNTSLPYVTGMKVLVQVKNTDSGEYKKTATTINTIQYNNPPNIVCVDNIAVDGASEEIKVINIENVLPLQPTAGRAVADPIPADIANPQAYNFYVGQRVKVVRSEGADAGAAGNAVIESTTTVIDSISVSMDANGNSTATFTFQNNVGGGNGLTYANAYLFNDDTPPQDNGNGSAPYTPDTIGYNIKSVDLCFAEWNGQMKNPPGGTLTYNSWKLDRRNIPIIPANSSYTGQVDLSPNIKSLLMLPVNPASGADSMLAVMDNLSTYRLYMNGLQTENRDINSRLSLWRDHTKRALVSAEIKDDNYANSPPDDDFMLIAEPVFQTNEPQSFEYHLFQGNANSVAKIMYFYKCQEQQIKL